MASLQRFKLLATQCAATGTEATQSPTTSPVIHLRRGHHRRRKTLRMLLRGRIQEDDDEGGSIGIPEKKSRRKLKDLLVSSPEDEKSSGNSIGNRDDRVGLLPVTGGSEDSVRVDGGLASRRGAGDSSSLRPVTASFRYRFLRRAWRPVLVTIPE